MKHKPKSSRCSLVLVRPAFSSWLRLLAIAWPSASLVLEAAGSSLVAPLQGLLGLERLPGPLEPVEASEAPLELELELELELVLLWLSLASCGGAPPLPLPLPLASHGSSGLLRLALRAWAARFCLSGDWMTSQSLKACQTLRFLWGFGCHEGSRRAC